MSFGQDIATFVAEMLETDGLFGSTMQWEHITRVETRGTGVVVETPATPVVFRGAVTDPVRTRLFSETTLVEARSAVVVLPNSFPWVPALLDRVEITPGRWLRVIDLKELLGPGDAGSPVLIAYVAALGAS